MEKNIQHIERRGLPGGPNEMFTYTTGVFSTEGFRMDSPDVNNEVNIIPSGSITMKERDGSPLRKGPIHGIDNLGNEQIMHPGYDYEFPGTEVTETLMAKMGGALLDKTIKCGNCGWEWKAADGGSDLYDCHKCKGGKGLIKAQRGSEIKRKDDTSKAIKRTFEKTEEPANWIEETFNKALSAITPDYESAVDREKLFKRYRPIAYPGIGSAISSLIKDSQLPEKDTEGDLNVGEEAWRKALSLPGKEKYIIPSAYKPTTSKDPNSKYYTLNNIIDKEKILAEAKKLGIKPGQKINLESMSPYIREGFMDADKFSNIDPLQKFQINMDPEGKYISIYDKYDFDFAPANKAITPYEFYDRFYFNDKDIPKSKPVPGDKKENGGESNVGSLMEAYNKLLMQKKMGGVIANKKQFGGQLNSANITMYKDYIKGNIGNEEQAIKNYDKLNRVYYNKAKELGMTAANYIMTYIADNS